MDLGFGGEVADLYHRYRHGYLSAAIDMLAETFGLNAQDMVIDVGCGTGQLTLPIAHRSSAAEPARREVDRRGYQVSYRHAHLPSQKRGRYQLRGRPGIPPLPSWRRRQRSSIRSIIRARLVCPGRRLAPAAVLALERAGPTPAT
jgi:SAM-dependent methyltransferase